MRGERERAEGSGVREEAFAGLKEAGHSHGKSVASRGNSMHKGPKVGPRFRCAQAAAVLGEGAERRRGEGMSYAQLPSRREALDAT